MRPDVQTLIIGAGFSGLGVAIALDRAGLGDYRIIEAAAGVGGTWYWNTYPGIAVDIPSFSYQFSFEQSSRWTRTYAPGRELRAYAEHCADKYGVRPRIRFNTTVVGVAFDDGAGLWRVDLDSGERLTARFLINAGGALTIPNLPRIEGLADFAGPTMHTARWDHRQDLAGKNVAIIGTGASAVQVIPELAAAVRHLTVFQRTPIWCFPKFDVPLPAAARALMRIPGGKSLHRWISQAYVELTFPIAAHYFTLNPFAKRMSEAGKAYLRREVHDPEVRVKLTPGYAVGCKRPGFHNTYLSTFNRDNVDLVTEPIERITADGVVTADARVHNADVLILATGFKVMDIDSVAYPITGSGGLSLIDYWDTHRFRAYEGVTVPGFPNMFFVFGPYGYVGSSYFALIEAQSHHIVRCLTHAVRRGANRIEVKTEASDRFFAEMLGKRHRQIFWQDSCKLANSYYFDKHGDVPLRPDTTLRAFWRSRRFPLSDYEFDSAETTRSS